MKIAVIGDLHGNERYARAVVLHAAQAGATHLLQVGDFGYWPRQVVTHGYDLRDEVVTRKEWAPQEDYFTQRLEEVLAEVDLPLWWLDGNHENHEALALLPLDEHGRHPLTAHISHLPRGYRWQWQGQEWLALGGAVSVDRNSRTPGWDWFSEEEITQEEATAALAGGPVRVMVTHDAPAQVPTMVRDYSQLPRFVGWAPEDYHRSVRHRRLLGKVFEGTGARVLLHGHYHHRYTDAFLLEGVARRVEGLSCDGGPLEECVIFVDAAGGVL